MKSIFRGFKSGFGRITLVWCIFSLAIVLLGHNLVAVQEAQQSENPSDK